MLEDLSGPLLPLIIGVFGNSYTVILSVHPGNISPGPPTTPPHTPLPRVIPTHNICRCPIMLGLHLLRFLEDVRACYLKFLVEVLSHLSSLARFSSHFTPSQEARFFKSAKSNCLDYLQLYQELRWIAWHHQVCLLHWHLWRQSREGREHCSPTGLQGNWTCRKKPAESGLPKPYYAVKESGFLKKAQRAGPGGGSADPRSRVCVRQRQCLKVVQLRHIKVVICYFKWCLFEMLPSACWL